MNYKIQNIIIMITINTFCFTSTSITFHARGHVRRQRNLKLKLNLITRSLTRNIKKHQLEKDAFLKRSKFIVKLGCKSLSLWQVQTKFVQQKLIILTIVKYYLVFKRIPHINLKYEL